MRFIYLTLANLHTNTCDLHSRAGTKMLARSNRLPPHPNTKRESGDETKDGLSAVEKSMGNIIILVSCTVIDH